MIGASDPHDEYMREYSASLREKEKPSMWAALAQYVAAPAKGKTIYNVSQDDAGSSRALMISGGVLAAGALAIFLLSRK